MKKVIYIIALLLGATTMAQTITVNGTPMLVSDDISFPFWLESGSSISPEVPVSSISVLEFNIVPNNNGNDMVFNQVISVTEGQTVPEGKTWKVESILMEDQSFEENSDNSSIFIPTNSSSININIQSPVLDSVLSYWTVNASILPSAGSPITERGFCFSKISQTPTVYDNIFNCNSGNGSFEGFFNNGNNVEANTTYYVRAFATNLEGLVYSEVQSFTTLSQSFPAVGQYHQGGIVFYLDESGDHGLIAASEDLGEYEWGCNGVYIGSAWGLEIGTGNQNTNDIIESGCTSDDDGLIASQAASEYQFLNYDDWFLPSSLELELMYMTIGQAANNLGGFSDEDYWSSTNFGDGTAYGHVFNFGNSGSGGLQRHHLYKVRAIRSF